jgi:hypothetical protein
MLSNATGKRLFMVFPSFFIASGKAVVRVSGDIQWGL